MKKVETKNKPDIRKLRKGDKICKLIILDEVNIKLENVETHILSSLNKKMSFYDPSAKYLPSYKIGRWDGKISYFDLSGKSYFHLLKEILEVLDEFKYKIQKEDRRQNKQIYTFDAIDQNYLKNQNIKWPETHHLAGKDIILRDYQVEVINYFLQRRHAVQEIATGAGKTIITAVLAKIVEEKGRTITIVPSKTLVKQTYEDYKNIGLDVGVFFGDQKDTENKHIIATWQSLEKIRKSKKEGDIYEKITKNMVAVIVDECHIAKAPSLKKILGNMYKNVPIRWGLTATLPIENYLFYAIKSLIGPPINFMSANDLQNKGILSSCDVHIIEISDDRKNFETYQEEKNYLLNDSRRLEIISNLINEISNDGNTLVLVDFVKTARKLGEMTKNSHIVTGSVKMKEKIEKFNMIKEKDNVVLIATYGVASVGINIPKNIQYCSYRSRKKHNKSITEHRKRLEKNTRKKSCHNI